MADHEKDKPRQNASLAYVSLVTLMLQNAALIIWLRYVRTRDGVDMFLSSSAVVMAEVVKFCVSLLLILQQEGSLQAWGRNLWQNLIMDPADNIKILVPSLVYVLQNNLQFIAISNLDAATYQVSYQLKILTTAMFSFFMLNKKLSGTQWGSLVILMLGVAAVQVQPSNNSSTGTESRNNPVVGMIAVIVSCLMSGFAGVYFEKILKGSSKSVWLRNVQLALYGAVLGLVTLYLKDFEAVKDKGFFYGYDWAVWLAIALNSLGGLLVAVVVKYADNILKGFATSGAIVLSFIVSIYFFNFQVSIQFVIGAVLVMASVYLYSKYPYQSSVTTNAA